MELTKQQSKMLERGLEVLQQTLSDYHELYNEKFAELFLKDKQREKPIEEILADLRGRVLEQEAAENRNSGDLSPKM